MTSVSNVTMTQTIADKANGTNTLSQNTLDAIAAANANNGNSDATTSADKLAANKETFIKLLTTQLQNQDPLQPTDTAAFTQQLVQYSQVEQQIGTNDKLDSILSSLTAGSSNQYIDYIGHNVAVSSTKLALSGGKSTISYTLPDNASTVKVQVLDSSNSVIATLTGDTKVGDHNVTWDGKKADGSQMNDGTYTFKIVATKADGSEMKDIKQYAVAPVTAIKSTASGAQLELSGILKVSPSDVIAIGS